jgi:hypothetical protein
MLAVASKNYDSDSFYGAIVVQFIEAIHRRCDRLRRL